MSIFHKNLKKARRKLNSKCIKKFFSFAVYLRRVNTNYTIFHHKWMQRIFGGGGVRKCLIWNVSTKIYKKINKLFSSLYKLLFEVLFSFFDSEVKIVRKKCRCAEVIIVLRANVFSVSLARETFWCSYEC